MTWYVDTSAAAKLLTAEAESEALLSVLRREDPPLASSYLLETELRRFAARSPGSGQDDVTELLTAIMLFEAPSALFRHAGLLRGASLRSLDALHCATAVQLGVDAVITYDIRMAEAARDCGLTVLAPGT